MSKPKVFLLGAGALAMRCIPNLLKHFHIVGIHCPFYENELRELAVEQNIRLQDVFEKIWDEEVDYYLMLAYPYLVDERYLRNNTVLNVHNSLLPKYRGLHAFVWALLNDEAETGYTLHRVNRFVDDGPIWFQAERKITDSDTIINLIDWMHAHASKNLAGAILRVISGEVNVVEQNRAEATYVTKRSHKDGWINWGLSARQIFNMVRALKPPYTPGAFTSYKHDKLVVTQTSLLPNPPYRAEPGKVVAIWEKCIWVKCGDSLIQIDEVNYKGSTYAPAEILNRPGLSLG